MLMAILTQTSTSQLLIHEYMNISKRLLLCSAKLAPAATLLSYFWSQIFECPVTISNIQCCSEGRTKLFNCPLLIYYPTCNVQISGNVLSKWCILFYNNLLVYLYFFQFLCCCICQLSPTQSDPLTIWIALDKLIQSRKFVTPEVH